jgi:hypothetical protein
MRVGAVKNEHIEELLASAKKKRVYYPRRNSPKIPKTRTLFRGA